MGKGPILLWKGHAIFGSWDRNIYSVNVETGEENWRFGTKSKVMSGAAVDPETDRIFIGSHDKGFRCISWDGKLVWSFGARDMIMSSPVVTQNLVIFGSLDGTVYGLHKGDGHL